MDYFVANKSASGEYPMWIRTPENERSVGRDVLDAIGRCDAGEIQTPQAARETLLASLSEDAIGRKYYSDRDPPIPGSEWREPLLL